jgi:hypothetical protein
LSYVRAKTLLPDQFISQAEFDTASTRLRRAEAAIRSSSAAIDGQLTYLGSTRFIGRWKGVCFLPYVEIVKPDFGDHRSAHLDRVDTLLLIVSSDIRP